MIQRSPSQLYFESLFTKNGQQPFQNVKKTAYEARMLTDEEANKLRYYIKQEALPYYYKALLSYAECIPAICHGNYSWATVKLYYSVFYSLKSFLACNGITILRGGMKRTDLLYIKAKAGETFKKCKDSTDHKGTLEVEKKFFMTQDLLLSQQMQDDGFDMTAYEWLARRREDANYKDIEFRDPNPSEPWESINTIIKKQGVSVAINKMIEDMWFLCFQDEYAILGIPTKRLLLTTEEIKNQGLYIDDTVKANFVRSMSDDLDNDIWSRFVVDKIVM